MAQKKELYQIAVWYRDGKADGEGDKIIVEPKTVAANNAGHAERIALLDAAVAAYSDKLDKVEVQVRPF